MGAGSCPMVCVLYICDAKHLGRDVRVLTLHDSNSIGVLQITRFVRLVDELSGSI